MVSFGELLSLLSDPRYVEVRDALLELYRYKAREDPAGALLSYLRWCWSRRREAVVVDGSLLRKMGISSVSGGRALSELSRRGLGVYRVGRRWVYDPLMQDGVHLAVGEDSGGLQDGVHLAEEDSGGLQDGVHLAVQDSSDVQDGVHLAEEDSSDVQDGVHLAEEDSSDVRDGADLARAIVALGTSQPLGVYKNVYSRLVVRYGSCRSARLLLDRMRVVRSMEDVCAVYEMAKGMLEVSEGVCEEYAGEEYPPPRGEYSERELVWLSLLLEAVDYYGRVTPTQAYMYACRRFSVSELDGFTDFVCRVADLGECGLRRSGVMIERVGVAARHSA